MIRAFLKFIGVLFLLGLILSVAQAAGMKESYNSYLAIAFLFGIWLLRKRKKKENAQSKNTSLAANTTSVPNPNGARYVLKGVNDVLEVFEHKITITPKTNFSSMLIRGLKGSKSVPIASIAAIQFREAKPINGYIQFTLPDGVESKGGIFAAIGDENTVFFIQSENVLAREIRDYIELRMAEIRSPKMVSSNNIADELQKLAALNAQGILSDKEFAAAKQRLIG